MKLKVFIILFLMIGFSLPPLKAQQGVSASGGEALGAGSASFTVGQVMNNYQTGTTGSVSQGVQQSYKIVTSSGEEYNQINVYASVYPNPTANILTISVKDFSFENLSYQLFDIQGRGILHGRINSELTILELASISASAYILKLTVNNKAIKTFRIIKN